MDLPQQAVRLYPSLSLAQKWYLAVMYLRSRQLWVLDQGSRKPSWANGGKR